MKKQFLLLIGISLFFFGNALASEVSFTGKVYMINPRSSSYGQAAYFSDYSAVTVPWGVETRNHPTDGAKQVVGVWIVAPGITVDNPQKAILATLLQAKASGSWVRIYHDSSTGVITQVEVY